MRKPNLRIITVLLAVTLCVAALSFTAYADGRDYYAYEPPMETTEPTDPPEPPEPEATPEPPFTPEGNLSLIDDIPYQSKQFITVQSKSGNYFYIIIDRAADEENVYFLNMVDEADLLALMDDGKQETAPTCTCKDHCEPGAVNTNCPVCKNNMSECMGKEAEKPSTDKDKEEKPADKETEKPAETSEKKSSGSLLIIVLILALAGVGALWWFKFRKKQPDNKGGSDLDDYDFGDDEDEYEIEEETDDENDESKGD